MSEGKVFADDEGVGGKETVICSQGVTRACLILLKQREYSQKRMPVFGSANF